MSEEALQISEKRREVKGKEEKERYTHLNADFQRIAMRNKKAFLSEQCKEIEVINRMGKTRVLFKKIKDIKGTLKKKTDRERRFQPPGNLLTAKSVPSFGSTEGNITGRKNK